MNQKRSEERDATPITVGVAAKLIGLRPRMVRDLIRDGQLAGQRLGRNFYTSRHAVRAFTHALVTCAPFRVGSLAPTP